MGAKTSLVFDDSTWYSNNGKRLNSAVRRVDKPRSRILNHPGNNPCDAHLLRFVPQIVTTWLGLSSGGPKTARRDGLRSRER
jgi:hypothetical protein